MTQATTCRLGCPPVIEGGIEDDDGESQGGDGPLMHSDSITVLQYSDRMAAKYCIKYMVKKYAEGEIEDDDGDGPPPLQSSSEDEDESQGEDGHGEICSEALKVLADSSSA